MVVCAAKSYLAQHGTPDKPADMVNFSWLEYSVRPDSEFELIAPEGISTSVTPQGRFVTNDPQTLVRWLKAGAGIAYVPLMWIVDEIKRGEIEILFNRYHSDPRPVYALYTRKDNLPLKVQVCINYMTEYFKNVALTYQGYRQDHGEEKIGCAKRKMRGVSSFIQNTSPYHHSCVIPLSFVQESKNHMDDVRINSYNMGEGMGFKDAKSSLLSVCSRVMCCMKPEGTSVRRTCWQLGKHQ